MYIEGGVERMNNKSQLQLASILTFGVGAWLVISPLFIAVDGAALTNVLITGGIIALAGLAQLGRAGVLPSGIAAIASLWLVVSTLVFSTGIDFFWNMMISAFATCILAVWDNIEVSNFQNPRSVV